MELRSALGSGNDSVFLFLDVHTLLMFEKDSASLNSLPLATHPLQVGSTRFENRLSWDHLSVARGIESVHAKRWHQLRLSKLFPVGPFEIRMVALLCHGASRYFPSAQSDLAKAPKVCFLVKL